MIGAALAGVAGRDAGPALGLHDGGEVATRQLADVGHAGDDAQLGHVGGDEQHPAVADLGRIDGETHRVVFG